MFEIFIEVGGVPSNAAKARDACGKIIIMMRTTAKDMNVEMPFNDLTIGMIRGENKKTKLKLKAAEGRRTLPILLRMLQTFFSHGAHATLRLQCVQALADSYSEFSCWVDGGESARRLARFGQRHLILYGELVRTKLAVWVLYPKHHLYAHLCEQAVACPSLEWNYMDENEIGVCARMARKCNQQFLEKALIKRYRCTFHANFSLELAAEQGVSANNAA